jgi:branched-chain amino acid transport system ATP-binding protein
MIELEVKGINVLYGVVRALIDFSLAVETGKIVVLLGPNGAGKSTFIRSVVGLVRVVKGEVLHRGVRIDILPVHEIARSGIALVPEGRRVFRNMSVVENLYVGGYQRTNREVQTRIDEIVAVFFPRLIERRRQIAGTMSGGEQQMLAIARALMSGPKLVLLDEPSLGLSPRMVKEVAAVVLRLNREKNVSMILVEQNTTLGFQLANYIYLVEGGRVRLEGTPGELSTSEEIVRAYIGTSSIATDTPQSPREM